MPRRKKNTLPPDPETMNEQRADAAGRSLDLFTRTFGEEDGGGEQNLSDLLADLAHYCDRNELHFAYCLQTAKMHYDAETDNEGRQFDISAIL